MFDCFGNQKQVFCTLSHKAGMLHEAEHQLAPLLLGYQISYGSILA
jgi:hypothetical protein